MGGPSFPIHVGLSHRVLWLYGLHALLSNICFLAGFYLLPPGSLRETAITWAGRAAAAAEDSWVELGRTLLFNLVLVAGLGVAANLQRIRDFPLGYCIPIVHGVLGGLIAGSNSFVASDLTRYDAWRGTALGLSIGGVELFAYVLIISATVPVGLYQYRSWTDWHPTKLKTLRQVRLSATEWYAVAFGALLLLLAAWRETRMAANLPV